MKIEGLSIIYKITNPINQIYIGKSKNWSSRFNSYKKLQCKNQKLLYKSIKHYGWDNHRIELVGYYPLDIINEKEIFYIKLYKSHYKDINGLNITKGGEGDASLRRKKFSNERLDKHLKMLDERDWKMESWHKSIISITHKGKKLPKEHKEAISLARSKPLIQYDAYGNPVKMWKSATEAGNILGINISNILACANQDYSSAGGFIWRFQSEYNFEKLNIDLTNGQKSKLGIFNKKGNVSSYNVIKVTNLKTNEILYFISYEECAKYFNIGKGSIPRFVKKYKGLMKSKSLKFEIFPSYSTINSYI